MGGTVAKLSYSIFVATQKVQFAMKNFEALPHLVSSVPDSPIKIDVDAVQDINGCRRYYVKIPLQIFVCLASDCFGFSYTNISVHYTISQATQSRKFE